METGTDIAIDQLRPIIMSIMDAHELIRRQTEERMNLLGELFIAIETYMEKNESNSDLVSKALEELHNINDKITTFSIQNATSNDDANYLRQLKIQSINKVMAELDQLEVTKNQLRAYLDELLDGIDGRDELMSILEEYVELGHASNYSLVHEIAELEQIKMNYERNIEMYSVLSRYDPRIQALTILEKHPQGISMYQLVAMLDISAYEAKKIVDSLVNMGMVLRNEGSDILHVPVKAVLGSIRR